jgi:hypothetical protein
MHLHLEFGREIVCASLCSRKKLLLLEFISANKVTPGLHSASEATLGQEELVLLGFSSSTRVSSLSPTP